MAVKRKDKNRVVLRRGESYRESDGRYFYRWTDTTGKRHAVYARTLDDLRIKEESITRDIMIVFLELCELKIDIPYG